MPAKQWAFAAFAHFFEAARRYSQIESGLGAVEKGTTLASCAGARVVQAFLLVFAVVFVTHRFTALDCGDLYVRKIDARPRAKMAIREIRHARDRALSGKANKSRIADGLLDGVRASAFMDAFAKAAADPPRVSAKKEVPAFTGGHLPALQKEAGGNAARLDDCYVCGIKRTASLAASAIRDAPLL